ncbi:hypothetical protein M5K25_021943 [Dendrobium thyrsiflorum]|uniref:Transmembrane protein n=1 Tax=Dendrobium thyrsiflorum TaxID=117978 RepID=A0ABD0UBF5_DENTH
MHWVSHSWSKVNWSTGGDDNSGSRTDCISHGWWSGDHRSSNGRSKGTTKWLTNSRAIYGESRSRSCGMRRRMKYFCAWLATCVGVLVTTKFLDMLRQSPLPYLSSPRRNSLFSTNFRFTRRMIGDGRSQAKGKKDGTWARTVADVTEGKERGRASEGHEETSKKENFVPKRPEE